jgi:hypothetical protein
LASGTHATRSGIIASHLFAGDDRDRSGHSPQRAHDRMRVTDGSWPLDFRMASTIAAVDVQV